MKLVRATQSERTTGTQSRASPMVWIKATTLTRCATRWRSSASPPISAAGARRQRRSNGKLGSRPGAGWWRHGWLNRFRRSWDKSPDNYIAFLHFACALIAEPLGDRLLLHMRISHWYQFRVEGQGKLRRQAHLAGHHVSVPRAAHGDLTAEGLGKRSLGIAPVTAAHCEGNRRKIKVDPPTEDQPPATPSTHLTGPTS